ncbi:MAG: hypothetical protein U1F29_13340 [Planctomycetota bacterium]
MKKLQRALLLAAVAVSSFAGSAHADGRNPGSLLIFPEYDHSPGRDTMLTVTNTSAQGGVRVHFYYVGGVPGNLCDRSNRTEVLTPSDTITLLTSAHSGQSPTGNNYKGFVYCYAENAAGAPISFNFLVGDEIVVDGNTALQYAVNPLVYKAKTPTSQPTDLDGDGVRDLNDVEYEGSPDRVFIPRFMGQSAEHQSDLILISLTGGANFTNVVNFLMFNDNEEVFSAQHSFTCWKKVPLTTISAMFANTFLHNSTNDAVSEIVGATNYESGWILVDGNVAYSSARQFTDPTILAVLVEKAGAAPNNTGAEIPWFTGKQFNGDLLPTSINGDSN